MQQLGDDAFATLARLFLLGVAVPVEEAAAALDLDDELVRVVGDRVEPLVRILPFEDLLLVSEPAEWSDGETPADLVPGITGVGVTVANLTPRAPVERMLDLGTGFGLHALLAARHADHVMGTDINARAVDFARRNADLNGIENVELRVGDLYEPVAGERFDLIVANPPFVVGPDRRYVFRDGGAELCERVVTGATDALADGGIAVISVGWPHDGVDRLAAPLGWLRDTGCDALLLRLADVDPLTNGWLHTRDAEATARWAAALRDAGAAGAGYGAIAMRRRPGGGRVTTLDLRTKDVPVAGAHIARILRNLEALDRNDPLELVPAEGLELRRVEQVGPSDDPPRPARYALRRGLPVTAEVDAPPERLLELGLFEAS